MKTIFRNTMHARMRRPKAGQLKHSGWGEGFHVMSWLGSWKYWSRWIGDEYESNKHGPKPK